MGGEDRLLFQLEPSVKPTLDQDLCTERTTIMRPVFTSVRNAPGSEIMISVRLLAVPT